MDKEIVWNIINSLLASAISFVSAMLAASEINIKVILISFGTGILVGLVKFRDYWTAEESEYKNHLFSIIGG